MNLFIILIALLTGIAGGYFLMSIIRMNGLWPSGSDTMYHLFRGDLLYKALCAGEGFPGWDASWYNGFAPMRYWPPLAPLLHALCQYLTDGSMYDAYLLYCAVIFTAGILSWTIVGIIRSRGILGYFLGVLWFFIPNNIYAMFGEGNLPRSLSMVFLPLFLCLVLEYTDKGGRTRLLSCTGLFMLIVLCHTGYAGMVALSVIVWMSIYTGFNGSGRHVVHIILSMLIAFLLTGPYLAPSLHGGISMDNTETFRTFFQSITVTLNPLYRVTNTPVTFYFGLSVFIICVFGAMASGKRSIPGFINAILIVLLTTETAFVLISVLPFSNIMWMLRFLSIAICMAFLALLDWRTLKKWILAIFLIFMAADCIPSLYWIRGNASGITPEDRTYAISAGCLLNEATEVCTQRIALMDLSSMGAEGAYLTVKDGDLAVFGAGWEAAATANNIVRINRALEEGSYGYLFTRCLTLGADTVLIDKGKLRDGQHETGFLKETATSCGYDIIDENNRYLLCHYDTDGNFGTRTDFKVIGIGSGADLMSLSYPNIGETSDIFLDHYRFEDLKDYDAIYLDGFTYDDQAAAEQLIKKMSDSGVRIIIRADGIPESRNTRTRTFLGVTCNPIKFENGYPILYTKNFGELDCDLFPDGHTSWSTYYLNGLKHSMGYIKDNGTELDFYGTGINDNIYYIGLDIPLLSQLTGDRNSTLLMTNALGITPGHLPEITIVPMDVSWNDRGITVIVPEDANTGIAFQDFFISDKDIREIDSLMHVQKGTTIISFGTPYKSQGIVLLIFGIICLILLIWYVGYNEKIRMEEQSL